MNTGTTNARQLTHDLHLLGVTGGDILFVHSSFTSLGPVKGGAASVIEALEEAVGSDGLLLMPGFNLVGTKERGKKKADARAGTWDIATTPSTTGYLTEFFRKLPGTVRSDHYSHSVAARGKGAEALVTEHRCRDGLPSQWDREPWGKTFGTRSPMAKAYRRGGKLLFVGTDHKSSTYIHFVETLLWDRVRRERPDAPFIALNRQALGERWDRDGEQKTGTVGRARCRLMSIRTYVDTLLVWALESPQKYAAPWAVPYFPKH